MYPCNCSFFTDLPMETWASNCQSLVEHLISVHANVNKIRNPKEDDILKANQSLASFSQNFELGMLVPCYQAINQCLPLRGPCKNKSYQVDMFSTKQISALTVLY